MESIFGNEAIPAEESSAEVEHEEAAAADTEEVNEDLDNQDLDQEESSSEQSEQGETLLAGKFKTPDELAKSYLELQKKFTQTSQQAKQPNHQGSEQQAGDADMEEVFWNQFQQNPLSTMRYLMDNVIAARMEPITAKEQATELGRMMDPIAKEFKQVRTEEGMNQLFAKIGEIAVEMGNPQLANNPSPRILRLAAQELYGDGKAALINSAQEAGREAAEALRRNKQNVNINTNSKKAPQAAPKSAADTIKEGILSSGNSGSIFG